MWRDRVEIEAARLEIWGGVGRCGEMWRDRGEVEAARRQPEPRDVDEQLPRLPEAAVELEGACPQLEV